jgi:hypothetical protein
MGTLHGLSAITVLKFDLKLNPVDQVQLLLRQSTSGITLLPDMPYDDTATHAAGTAIQNVYGKFKAKPPTAIKADVDIAVNNAAEIYNQNAAYIESMARKAAKAAGDISVGIKLVENAGYFLKGPKSPTVNGFTAEPEGAGSVRVNTKAVAPHAGYVRQYGVTTAEGVPPTKCEELLFSLQAEIHISSLTKASILGVREASIIPVGRSGNDSLPETKVEKAITPKLITKAHKLVFSDTETTHYKWGDWIYVVVT